MEKTRSYAEDSSFDVSPLKEQNLLIANRLKAFDTMMLLIRNLPNYPFTNMAPERLQTIEMHATNAVKHD